MASSIRLRYSIICHFFILGMAFSCGFEKEEKTTAQGSTAPTEAEEALQLINSGLQQLPNWISYWKRADSGFDPTAFTLGKEEIYEQLEWPEENFINEQHHFFPYLLPQPEGEGVVDIYSYKIVYPEEKKPFLNPDSEVIFFKSNGMRERLLFMGPSGTFDEAKWVSPDHLMVTGRFETVEGVTPKIWLIIPSKSKYYVFDHPLISQTIPKDGYLKEKFSQIDWSDEL